MPRLSGPVQFGQGGFPIPIGPGGIFFPPPGNYLLVLGPRCQLQYFDPNQLCWRVVAQPGRSYYLSESDGYNFRIVNMSGVVAGTLITNAGSGAVNGIGSPATGVTVSFGAAPAGGVAAAAYPIVGGQINSVLNIVQAGSGFTVPPLLLIDPPPPGGIQATAVVTTLTAGAIGAVAVTNQGAGYVTAPNVYVIPQFATYQGVGLPVNPATPTLSPPPGLATAVVGNNSYPNFLPFLQWPPAFPATSGALITANPTLVGGGTLTGIVMSNFGAKYLGVSPPTIVITGAGAAAASPIMSHSLQSITITNGGAAYSVNPIWFTDAAFVALTDGANNVYGPRPAFGNTGTSGGVINATNIEDAGYGFQGVPSIGVIQAGGTPATTVATLTAVVGGVNDVCILQSAVQ